MYVSKPSPRSKQHYLHNKFPDLIIGVFIMFVVLHLEGIVVYKFGQHCKLSSSLRDNRFAAIEVTPTCIPKIHQQYIQEVHSNF